MNLKRFTARTPREALALVRQTFGEDAVVMSTKPCAEGVEVLAMAGDALRTIEQMDAPVVREAPPRAAPAAAPHQAAPNAARVEPTFEASVEEDVAQLSMSTLSFQDYVRERMLKRRQAEMSRDTALAPVPSAQVTPLRARRAADEAPAAPRTPPARDVPVLREEIHVPGMAPAAAAAPKRKGAAAPMLADAAPRRDQHDMLVELRSMRGLIEQRFGALAFMEKLQRQPRHAQLTHKLLDCGFSPTLTRRLADALPADGDETAWATAVLERNLATGEDEPGLEERGGVYALIGSTGVGKTTSTAKLAAAFAARFGASNLGLITLDAYRIGAHEQLRSYGRILGVPLHTAHDRASLEDLLDLLGSKKMVLIDTAGMAQRDSRTRELLEMLVHRSIRRLLVMNAAAQGETFEEVVAAYGAAQCAGVVLSKIDEAVKLGPALDVLIRHKLKVLAVANGQRVPEDWHRLSASALVQRALRGGGSAAWRLDVADVNLVFAAAPAAAAQAAAMA
jgi:flagellar biosynthesis protein FlhF